MQSTQQRISLNSDTSADFIPLDSHDFLDVDHASEDDAFVGKQLSETNGDGLEINRMSIHNTTDTNTGTLRMCIDDAIGM
jgi:hypothetical protein